jgi:type IV pilus assembly protein PilM
VWARAAVGLDIGTSSVRAAELSFGRAGTTLTGIGQVALPDSAVRAAEVVDPEAVTAALKELWSQTRFRSKRVVVGLANQKVVVRQVDMPWMPLPELKASLRFQAQEFLPMPVEHSVLDVHPLEEVTGDNGQRLLRVLLVAAAREMVDTTLSAVTAAGLRPVMVDLTPFAVLRALAVDDALGLRESGAEALVDVGARVTNIVVHEAGVPRFVRILLMGGADVTDAVAERLGVVLQEAEALKQTIGLTTSMDVLEHPAPEVRVLEAAGSSFIEQVRGSLDYYRAQPGSARITRMLLSGGGAQLPGLARRMSTTIGVPVEHATPMPHLVIGDTGLTDEQLEYVAPLAAVPVGLALGLAS